MSITIVTGVPGSGKTLYTVSMLLKGIPGTEIDARDTNDQPIKIKRTIYTNINGLLLDHELIDGGDNQGLRDWHKWAKPGSLIVFDEFQKVWQPRPNGSKVPEDIQALDTHRHMGVDFILVCQHLMNVDRHILGLCDRHLHIRRVANMPMSVVYEWDHASRSLLYKNALTKSPWRFPKDAYKLYKSAEVHTKQRRKVPGLVWFILVGAVGAAVAAPSAFNRISERMDPTRNTTIAQLRQPGQAAAAAPGLHVPAAPSVAAAASMPATSSSNPAGSDLELAGCAWSAARGCICYTSTGRKILPDPQICQDAATSRKPALQGTIVEERYLPPADALQSAWGPDRPV